MGDLYWYTLSKTYNLCDNLFDFKSEIKEAFSSNEPNRNTLMSRKEVSYLQSLPTQVKIYRGMTLQEYEAGDYGVSWTLKKEVAEFFAFTYGRNFSTKHLTKTVHEILVKKAKIIAYFGERNEFEVIYIHPTKK